MNILPIATFNFNGKLPQNSIKKFENSTLAKNAIDEMHAYKPFTELIPNAGINAKEDTKYIDEFVRTRKLINDTINNNDPSVEFINESTIL